MKEPMGEPVKELPNKFRFKANGYYYLAELSTQADAYALSQTDVEGEDIRNLNHTVLKESALGYFKSGHWGFIEGAAQDVESAMNILSIIREYVKQTGGCVTLTEGGYDVYLGGLDVEISVQTDEELVKLLDALIVVNEAVCGNKA